MRPFSWRWGVAWSDPQISWFLAYSTPWKGHLKGLYHCSSLFLANVTLSSFMGGPKKFPRCCLTACELLSKHIIKQVAYKHWALIHYTSRGWEGQNHGTADSLSSEALSPRWRSFHHSHMEEGKGLLWSLFCKSTNSIHGAPPSWTDHFTSTITWWSPVAWVWLFATLWTISCQAPLLMGSSRQEYWNGLPCPPPGYLPDPGIKPMSLMSPELTGRKWLGFQPMNLPGRFIAPALTLCCLVLN